MGSHFQENSRIAIGRIEMEMADKLLSDLLRAHEVDKFESSAGGSQYQYTLRGFEYRHPSKIGAFVYHLIPYFRCWSNRF
jgi:hypothetical protein